MLPHNKIIKTTVKEFFRARKFVSNRKFKKLGR